MRLGWPGWIKVSLAFWLTALCFACVHTSSQPHVEDPLLWQVTKDGQSAWLFGTVHVGVDAKKELPDSVFEAFNGSNCFVMESNAADVDLQQVMALAALPSQQDLRVIVGPETWKKIVTRLRGVMPEQVLSRLKPWFVALIYLQAISPVGQPMDTYFQQEALASGKKVHYLEDWREAIKSFSEVTDADDLRDLILNEEDTQKETQKLLAVYRRGNLSQLEDTVTDIMDRNKNAEARRKRLLIDRNEAWLPRVKSQAKAGRCFIAVGAGHLLGQGSLLELLKRDGYQVKRIN